jgi:hypothetical protein
MVRASVLHVYFLYISCPRAECWDSPVDGQFLSVVPSSCVSLFLFRLWSERTVYYSMRCMLQPLFDNDNGVL